MQHFLHLIAAYLLGSFLFMWLCYAVSDDWWSAFKYTVGTQAFFVGVFVVLALIATAPGPTP